MGICGFVTGCGNLIIFILVRCCYTPMFQFKQFNVDQAGCAMKINTDGVLLGAMADADNPANILDIGTGTGVIALMLGQRFTNAKIDAVEIDESAAQTSYKNFRASSFADRLSVYTASFKDYFFQYPERKYDLIISNPPFFIDSLKSPGAKKALAKHTDVIFFERLVEELAFHLSPKGCCWLILPLNIAELVIKLAAVKFIFPEKVIKVFSYKHSAPHRIILCLRFDVNVVKEKDLSIYKEKDIYSDEYKKLLRPYFLAF